MATITSLKVDARGSGNRGRMPYFVQTTLDFSHADIDALSAGDIVEAITVPANTMVVTAGAEMITTVQTAADGNTVNLGITGTDVDAYVAAIDIDDDASNLSSGVGYLTAAATAANPIILGSSDTIDLELQATTTAPTEGKIRIFAVLLDVDGMGIESTGGVAALAAAEADRDLLA